jgi:hypothetical protein
MIMKVLFLDIDGVLNYEAFWRRYRGAYGIDNELAARMRAIKKATKAKLVLSSAWRGSLENERYISRKVGKLFDRTPRLSSMVRGEEIKAWLVQHPEVTQYAIVDDDSDMLPDQIPHFFQTSWKTGITDEVASAIERHLLYGDASA